MIKTMLIDNSLCMGCRGCQGACKQWNQLPAEKTNFDHGTYENPLRFSANTWTKVAFREFKEDDKESWVFTKLGCMHCVDAACEKACPAAAISRNENGSVVIDEKKCIACNYCVANCTFDVMGFDRVDNVARKCTFFSDRISAGEIPACAKACPTGAITYGSRNDMLDLATERVGVLRKNGFSKAEVYGVNEVGGTMMLYVLREGKNNAEEKYGLPEDPNVPMAAVIWNYIFKPVRVVLVGALAFALWANKNESKKV